MTSNIFLLALGQAIRSRRKAVGLSQDAFAEKTSLHRTYIGGIERGERNISVENLLRIATGLNVRLSVLIAEAEDNVEKGIP